MTYTPLNLANPAYAALKYHMLTRYWPEPGLFTYRRQTLVPKPIRLINAAAIMRLYI